MRTTLSLDDDVTALLARVQKATKKSFKETVNETLRQGLQQFIAPPKKSTNYRTPSVSLGHHLYSSLDDVAEILAVTEGEKFQ